MPQKTKAVILILIKVIYFFDVKTLYFNILITNVGGRHVKPYKKLTADQKLENLKISKTDFQSLMAGPLSQLRSLFANELAITRSPRYFSSGSSYNPEPRSSTCAS